MWFARTGGLLLLVPAAAFGCSCRELTECHMLRAEVLFVGEVIEGGVASIADDPWNATHVKSVRFRVLEAFRGVEAGELVSMDLHVWPGMCDSIPYFPGRKYIVRGGRGADGRLSDGPCFAGTDLEHRPELARFFRDYFARRIPVSIRGRVGTFRGPDSSSFWFDTGLAAPLQGARVIAQRGGATVETMSNRDGEYTLRLPAPGRYTVRALLHGHTPQPDQVVEAPAGSCASADIGMTTANRISGRVTSRDGKPVQGAKLLLIPEDPSRSGLQLESSTSEDGAFEFGGGWQVVPNGRYRVAVNPEKPTGTHRFEPSFHPRTVELTGGNTRREGVDIVVGRLIGFRKIRVRTVLADGRPMNHAVVHATFASNPKWKYGKVTIKDGVAEFHAPSEAPVRIWLSDSHGRDMGAKYEAEFPADWRTIEHRFVVAPVGPARPRTPRPKIGQ